MKGTQQEWVRYFEAVNGRKPTQSELFAARNQYEPAGATATPAVEKPVDQISGFFANNNWQDKQSWENLIHPGKGLATTLSILNVVVGVIWIIGAMNLNKIKATYSTLARLSFLSDSETESAAQTAQNISDFNHVISWSSIVVWLLALALIGFGLNYIFKFFTYRRLYN